MEEPFKSLPVHGARPKRMKGPLLLQQRPEELRMGTSPAFTPPPTPALSLRHTLGQGLHVKPRRAGALGPQAAPLLPSAPPWWVQRHRHNWRPSVSPVRSCGAPAGRARGLLQNSTRGTEKHLLLMPFRNVCWMYFNPDTISLFTCRDKPGLQKTPLDRQTD